jgi:hypothetical protein
VDRRDSRSQQARQPKGWWQQYLAWSGAGKNKTAAAQPKPRVRLTLLILLWAWAALVFVVVDLFREVPAFDRVRPRGGLYQAMRATAHEMVGESLDGAQGTDDLVRAARHRAEVERTAHLESTDWERVWRERHDPETRGSRGNRAHDPLAEELPSTADLTIALQAALQRTGQGKEWVKRAEDVQALADLLREQGDGGEILGAAAALLQLKDVPQALDLASRLVHDVLSDPRHQTTAEEAYRIVGDAATEVLERQDDVPARAEEPDVVGRDRAKARAADVLAAIGTPQATDTLLTLLEGGSPYARSLAHVTNPDSVPLLAGRLCERHTDHLIASPIATGLAGSGSRGREELRRLLDSLGFGWREHGPAKGAALTALAAGFREPEDLFAIAAAIAEMPELLDAVAPTLRYAKKAPEQAAATVTYLTITRESLLDDPLLDSLALYAAGTVDPLMAALESARPGSRSRVEASRSRVQRTGGSR